MRELKGVRVMNKFFRHISRAVLLKALLVGLMIGGLSGCATNTVATLPEITFTHHDTLKLAVSQVRVEETFVVSQTPPRAETRLNQPPMQVLRRWAGDRLAVGGAGGLARFIIVDASVTEQALDTDGNFTAYFTNEQSLRYEAVAEAVLEVESDDGLSKGRAKARVSKSTTLAENSTLNERERAMFKLVEELMIEFNARMEESIRTHLSKWVM